MNYEIFLTIALAVIGLAVLLGLLSYHAFIVSEGFAGLLYRNGKYVEQLAAGRHVRWGRNLTLNVIDTRKTSVVVAGQDVLKAKQEGQAALERARGESAALRNLANAARVLEGNLALMNLRVLQSLATAQNAGNTLVLGLPAGFVPLKNGKAGSPAPKTEDDGAS